MAPDGARASTGHPTLRYSNYLAGTRTPRPSRRLPLMNKQEQKVRDFYDSYGWVKKGEVSGEDALFRKFSRPHYRYHDGVNARTLECFADLNGRLLMAGGGDLPEPHVAIANKFSEATCLDISKLAIDIARRKLENRGEFI